MGLGPIARRDKCLYDTATLLAVIRDVFPPDTEFHAQAAASSHGAYSAILIHFPDSRYADKAREALQE